ncbi:MAG: hypothetical protein B5M53_04785 [Candidatus Cloacimonas sp. 4484_209]|nr:MAG: hypothetical protein B5M53_04785 [Candidatus Cloacimonas sp. 4484_209]
MEKKRGVKMDIKTMVEEIKDKLITFRRHLHQIPELAYEEFETAKYITKILSKLNGISVKTGIAKTGVVGLLKGSGKKTIALRADIDALPITEENDIVYKSKHKGKMHACGHDAHMSILLGTAIVLSKISKELKGNVKFIFQPSEERTPGGAKRMIEEGVLKNPKVNAILGLHSDPRIPTGSIGYKPGVLMAFTSEFTINLQGKGGHAASPNRAIDPIVMASVVIQEIQKISSRWINPLEPVVVTIGSIHGGTTFNIISDNVELKGTVRVLNMKLVDKIINHINNILKGITKIYGGKYTLDFVKGYPVLKNDEKFTQFTVEVLKKTFGDKHILKMENPLMGGEDFAYYLQKVPGTFLRLGTANKNKKTNFLWHHSKFNIDEDALPVGVTAFVACTLNYLNNYE